MERPGLLEFAVYALVLTATAGWVYALPPFDYEPGSRLRFAAIQPVSAPAPDHLEGEESEPVTQADSQADSQDGAAGAPPVAQPQPDTASQADEQPRPDARPSLLVVTARSLNMRSEPDAGSARIGNYPRGALVEPVETSGNWVRVRTEDDATGWMYTGYLRSASN